jgi:putative RecB family exonuclease
MSKLRLSLSQLDTYAKCGYAWKLAKRDRVPQMTAAWFIHGTAVHSACEAWERSGRTLDIGLEFERVYEDLRVKELVKTPDESMWLRGGRKSREQDIEERRGKGRAQSQAYAAWAVQQPWRIWELPDGSPALELAFVQTLGGVDVLGYIDAVWEWPDGSIEPVDLKSGTKLPDNPRQLGLYGVAIETIFGVPATHGRYLMLKDMTDRPVALAAYTAASLGESFAAMARGVEANAFVPNPGSHCFTCTSKLSCAFAV